MATYINIPPVAGSGPGSTFVGDQISFLSSLIPQLTRFERIKIGQSPMGQALSATSDGAVEGGARTAPNATGTMFGASIFQTLNTGRWAMSIRAKFAAPQAGRNAFIGLSNAAGSHDLMVGTFNTVSATNYVMIADGTTSTTDDLLVARDASLHTFSLTGDTANLKVYVDGTLKVTRAIGTNVVDEPTYMIISNTIAGDAVWADFVYGFVAP